MCLDVTKVQLAQPLCESVGEAAADLLEDVPLVIVAKSSRDFVVRHLGTVSVFPPQSCESLSVVESKQTLFPFLPRDHVLVFGLFENAESKLPQLGTGWDI